MNVLPDFALSEAKAREGGVAAERLNDVMRDSAQQHHWTFVDAHRAAFRGRGICATVGGMPWSMADEMRLPRKVDGLWEPYNPSEWQAYAPRQRWFRTPNDAFMTGNFHVSQSLLQKRPEDADLLVGAAAAGQHLLRGLPSHRRRPGGDRRCGGRAGARGARQVRTRRRAAGGASIWVPPIR